MYRSASVAVMAIEDTAQVFLSGTDSTIPVIAFGPSAEAFEITLNNGVLTPEQQVAWLRGFAAQVEDLAEQVEQRHGLQTPRNCDCGIFPLEENGEAFDVDEPTVRHTATWCRDEAVTA